MDGHLAYFLSGPTRYIGDRAFDRRLEAVRLALADVRSAALSKRSAQFCDGLSEVEKEVSAYIWLMFSSRYGNITEEAKDLARQSIERVRIHAAKVRYTRPAGWRRYSRRMYGLRRKMLRFYRLICAAQTRPVDRAS